MRATAEGVEISDWRDYVRQPIMFTEAFRGGPLVWPAGATHLYGDPLGPVRHVHDGAAEYYYVLRGACLVEISGEERVAEEGDLVYIPADAPHNLLHEVGGVDAWTFIMVAPNFQANKWRTTDLPSDERSPKMTLTRPLEGDRSAEGNPFPAELVELARDGSIVVSQASAELVYLMVDGECQVRVGALAGRLGGGRQLHIFRDVEHEIAALSDRARLLRFTCAFVPFAGVELGPEGAHHKY
jgi:quercetin dioxygenase-like cupin family protein